MAAEDEYLALPDRFEIDEYRMMERFATGLDDVAARDAALAALRGRAAFRFFKDTVHRLGLAPAWYALSEAAGWTILLTLYPDRIRPRPNEEL